MTFKSQINQYMKEQLKKDLNVKTSNQSQQEGITSGTKSFKRNQHLVDCNIKTEQEMENYKEYEPSSEGRKLLDDYWNVAFKSGKQEAKEEVFKVIDERIKIWEKDILGKPKRERYWGVSGCVLKELEELKQKLEGVFK